MSIKQSNTILLIGWICLLSISGFAYSDDAIKLVNSLPYYAIDNDISFYEDVDKQLTIEEIIEPEVQTLFLNNHSSTLNFGMSKSAFWIKIKVQNINHPALKWFLELGYTHLDDIQFFKLMPDGHFHMIKTGDYQPFNSREYNHPNFIFLLHQELHSIQTYYLRIVSEGNIKIPLSIQTQQSLIRNIHKNTLLIGAYYGCMIALIFYNMFLFFSIRHPSYIYYVIYVISFTITIFSINGLSYQYLWPDSPIFQNTGLPFLLIISLFWGLIFTRSILSTHKHLPKIDRFIVGCLIFLPILAIASPITGYSFTIKIIIALLMLVTLVVLFASVYCVNLGFRAARYYLAGWIFLLLGVLLYVLRVIGVLPALFITDHGLQIGSLIEVLLLSLGLGDRINTIRLEKEAAQQEAITNLKKADEIKDQFMANMSHELRTPLNAVIGYSEIIEEELMDSGNEEVMPFLRKINVSGKKIQTLVENVLNLTRIETGDIRLDIHRIELCDIIRSTCTEVKQQCDSNHNKLVIMCDYDDVYVESDVNVLEQILSNIIGNAFKFTQDGVITIDMKYHQVKKKKWINITVKDTGIGIAEEHFVNIFKSFYQIDGTTTRQYEGVGLGLALVDDYCKLIHANVSVESVLGKSSSFTISIPESF